MSGDILWKNLCFVRDGAADVVADFAMRRLIDWGYVTLDRRLTDKGLAKLAAGDAEWRAAPSIVPDDAAPIRAWRARERA
jgi:hypothetical protein